MLIIKRVVDSARSEDPHPVLTDRHSRSIGRNRVQILGGVGHRRGRSEWAAVPALISWSVIRVVANRSNRFDWSFGARAAGAQGGQPRSRGGVDNVIRGRVV